MGFWKALFGRLRAKTPAAEGDPFEISWDGYICDERSYPEWKPE